MDTKLWGSRKWETLIALIRVLDPEYLPGRLALPTDEDRLLYASFVERLVWALQYVLPCRYCRDSYRQFLAHHPFPPIEEALLDRGGNSYLFVEWLWEVKELVNTKLNLPPTLSLVKFRRRILSWSMVIGAPQLWDLLLIIALNYPKNRGEHSIQSGEPDPDPEREKKRFAYLVFLDSLSHCLPKVAFLRDMAPFLSVDTLSPVDVRDKAEFALWFRRQREAWCVATGLQEFERIAISCADEMATLYAVG